MKAARVFSLLFRYVTLIILGYSLAYFWRVCRLEEYESWGKFYALWIPALYGIFSTGYILTAEYYTRIPCFSEPDLILDTRVSRFRQYDDATYLLPLGVIGLEIATPYLNNVYLWLSISYLVLLIVKTTLFLLFLYGNVCQISEHTQPHAHVPLPLRMTLLLTALSVYALISGYHIHRTTTTGDEPHYLLITHSLWYDHDTNLYNNYRSYKLTREVLNDLKHEGLPEGILESLKKLENQEIIEKKDFLSLVETHIGKVYTKKYRHPLLKNAEQHDYSSFFWYEMQAAAGDRVSDSEVYSYRHKGLFPHTLLPGYVLGGRLGAALQINLITALLMLQVFLLSYELFHSLTASFLTWSCLTFTIPVIIYMGQIYPETLAALLTIWGVRRIRMLHLREHLKNLLFWKNFISLGLVIVLLVFLKTRYLPLAATLIIFLLYHLFQEQLQTKYKVRMLVNIGLILFVGAILIFFIDKYLFDSKIWDRISDAEYMRWMLQDYNPLFGFLGFLFDQEYGILPYTPLYILPFIGVGMLKRKEFKTTLPVFGIFFFNYLALSFWSLWHAAPTPPARYIFPVLPLLGVFLANFFAQQGRLTKVVVLGVCSIWSALSAWIVTINPWWRYNWADGTNNLLEMLSWQISINLTKLFPSWIRGSTLTPYMTLLGLVCLGAIIYACRREAKLSGTSLPRHVPVESTFLIILVLFMSISLGGLSVAKFLPTFVLETEDRLDVRTYGGKRIPQSLDPWDNQIYFKKWKYTGWELSPGDRLQTRPKLHRLLPGTISGVKNEWQLQIYARTPEEGKPKDFPVMRIRVNQKEIAHVTVSATDNWKAYNFTLRVDETNPLLEIIYQLSPDSQRMLIIDKLRFQ